MKILARFPQKWANIIRLFSPRRAFFARWRRNSVVRWIAQQCYRNYEFYENHDYMQERNGEFQIIEKLCKANYFCEISVVFDVGAHIGDWAIYVHTENPNVTVHAFELLPAAFEKLARNTSGIPKVVCNDFGLSDREDSVEIWLNQGGNYTSIYRQPGVNSDRKMTAHVISGDEYISRNRIKNIEFLKIDVEGAEYEVLDGLKDSISNDIVKIIQFEYNLMSIQSRSFLKDFYDLLSKNYTIGKIYPTYVDFRGYHTDHENFMGANYLAVHKTMPDVIRHLSE